MMEKGREREREGREKERGEEKALMAFQFSWSPVIFSANT
jgi:hypothetical protein